MVMLGTCDRSFWVLCDVVLVSDAVLSFGSVRPCLPVLPASTELLKSPRNEIRYHLNVSKVLSDEFNSSTRSDN